MEIFRKQLNLPRKYIPEIDPSLLVVRGARFYGSNIERLLTGPVPQPPERVKFSEESQVNLKGDFCARLLPVISSGDPLVASRPELMESFFAVDDATYVHDKSAVGVHILAEGGDGNGEFLKVGHISRLRAPQVRQAIEPLARRGKAVEFGCTIFWNGDPEDGLRFYSVQLFNVSLETIEES